MKKQIVFYTLVLAVCSLLSISTIFAQEEEKHVYVIATFKAVMPEDGSIAERDALLTEWVEGVIKKNEHILSSKELRHRYGDDSHDWIVISEYKSWGDIEAAGNRSQELFKQHMPDEKKRAEFWQKITKYFPSHSDEIYDELPQFNK